MGKDLVKRDFTPEVETLKNQMGAIKVTSRATYDNMVAVGVSARAFLDEVSSTFDPIIAKAHEAHKEAVAQKKAKAKPFEDIITFAKDQCRKWLQIEKEREAAAEAKRQKAIAKAEKLAKAENGPTPVPPPAPVNYAKANKNIVYVTVWKAEIVDAMEIIKAVAAGKLPINAVDINTTFFNRMATAQKELAKAPGVSFHSEEYVRI